MLAGERERKNVRETLVAEPSSGDRVLHAPKYSGLKTGAILAAKFSCGTSCIASGSIASWSGVQALLLTDKKA